MIIIIMIITIIITITIIIMITYIIPSSIPAALPTLLQPVQRGQQRIGDFFQVVAQGEADPGANFEGVEYLCIQLSIYISIYVYIIQIYIHNIDVYIYLYTYVYIYTDSFRVLNIMQYLLSYNNNRYNNCCLFKILNIEIYI